MYTENTENNELNLEQMEEVSGGKRHFKPEKDRGGNWVQHRVVPGDTLIRLAKTYGVKNWRTIIDWNPHIDRTTNIIVDGEYLWIRDYR